MKTVIVSMLLCIGLYACGKCNGSVQYVDVLVTAPAANINLISCNVYDLSNLNPTSLPDYDTLQSEGSVQVSSLNFPSTDPTVVFPPFVGTSFSSLETEFGLDCTATFVASTAGSYTFYTNSDDGSDVFMDGVRVVNNDGEHSMTKVGGSVTLAKGKHELRVPWYQNPGYKGLILTVVPPGGTEVLVDQTMLSQ